MYLSYKQLLDMNGTPVYSIDLDRWVLVQVLDETFENRIILRDSRGFKWNWNHKCVLKGLSDGTRRSSRECLTRISSMSGAITLWKNSSKTSSRI